MKRKKDFLKLLGIGRFQVMALLQAARYYIAFEENIERAKSFGLNRAIFYAWAKHYGPRRRPIDIDRVLSREDTVSGAKCSGQLVEVLGECLEKSRDNLYVIGGQVQTPSHYDQQVTKRIEKIIDYSRVWRAALEYVSKFPRWVLRDPQKFYKYVYEPVRDSFLGDLVEEGRVREPQKVLEKLRALEKASRRSRELGLDRFIRENKRGS